MAEQNYPTNLPLPCWISQSAFLCSHYAQCLLNKTKYAVGFLQIPGKKSVPLSGDAEKSIKSFWGSKHLMPRSGNFSRYLAPFPLVSSTTFPVLLTNEISENQKYLFCLNVRSRKIMTALDSIS